jgi:radical SAM superfamily enzyme YgiQ (UPF0313 family)
MYDVLLFTDNTNPIQISTALGAYKIACVLRKHDYKVLVVNYFSKFDINEMKRIIDSTVTDNLKVIGFSTTFLKTTDFKPLSTDVVFPQGKEFENEVIAYALQLNPKIKFIIGGAKSTQMCPNTNIDYAFIGYSESSIVNLLGHLTNGAVLKNSSINPYGVTIIDDRTAPEYNFAMDPMIWEETDILNHKVLPLEIGRGCIFKCKFCSFPLRGKDNNLDYVKQPDILYQELLNNYEKYGIKHYLIVDDTFNDNVHKLIEIEKVVKRLPFQPILWCYARLDLICTKPHTIELLYNIGVRGLYFGIETLDERAGRIIGKGYDRQKQINMIAHIKETYPDIQLHGSFIMGLPNETMQSMLQTGKQLSMGETKLDSWAIRGLLINYEDTLSFNSEIDLNYSNYGYIVSRKNSGSHYFWKNQHTNFDIVNTLSTSFMSISKSKDYYKLPGHDMFETINFGYKLEEIKSIPYKDFRFDIIESQEIPKFINEYKTLLFAKLDK